jgi:hypothetical protein
MTIFGLIDTIKNARATIRNWAEYRRETGRWPLLSIAVHLANFVVFVAIVVGLILFTSRRGWSHSRVSWILILGVLVYFLLWSWVDGKVKLNEIRNRRRFAKSKKLS